jgi:glycosyltransferase involved in cell wall biosynthesis
MRIVIDVRHLKDFGIGTYIRNLVRGLAAAGAQHDFLLVARPADAGEFANLPGNFTVIPFGLTDQDLSNDVSFPLFLARLRPHLVHMPLNTVPVFMPRPYVVTVHDLSSLLFPGRSDLRSALHEIRYRRGLERAEQVLAVSAATRRDVEQVLGIPARRIRLIHNALDPEFLNGGGPSEEQVRSTLERFSIQYPFVLYAGTIRPQKNIPRLVEAFSVLRGELEGDPHYGNLRLVIIGDEISRHPEVRRAVNQSRVGPAVRFLGFVPLDALRAFYRAAELFAFPSLYEGFGLPPLEAMACGTPVVTSNVSSLPEVVGDAAVMVNPENVFEIARGMREVLLHAELRRELIEKGRRQLARFSWEENARAVLEAYAEAAGRRAPV